ncbi:MAG TPA: aminoacyl-tRNA hydrolase [Anaerolineae bacterium]|nr:aminoacyl-tRNA hydrolase [Caldilineae bacterium]HID34502.1 aminoacyl-tRNA hydrolase [Anaerolineae bacterium]
MNDDAILHIRDNLHIPMGELTFRASRSSGPGGQRVNRSETRVELLWDVRHSPSLSKTQRHRIEQALAGRIDKEGVLHLVSGERRSQLQNKQTVIERFMALLREATQPPKKRIPTRPPEAAKERRLREKRRRSEIKKVRGKVMLEE